MASYQDIDIRLKVVEEKLDWVMKQFKMQRSSVSPMLGPNGEQQVKVETTDLLKLYYELKTGVIEEVSNGTSV